MGHGPRADGGVGQDGDGVGLVGDQARDGGQAVVVLHLLLLPEEHRLLRLQGVEHAVALSQEKKYSFIY